MDIIIFLLGSTVGALTTLGLQALARHQPVKPTTTAELEHKPQGLKVKFRNEP